MINVQLNSADFEYDIHSLVKAFFPKEEVLVSAEKREIHEGISFRIDIAYKEHEIDIHMYEPQIQTTDLDQEPGSCDRNDHEELHRQLDVSGLDRPAVKNRLKPVSYTHLDVYKRQSWNMQRH